MAITLGGLIAADPTLETQLPLVAVWGIIWFLLIKFLSKSFFEPFIKTKPWCDKWTELNRKTFKNSFFIDFNGVEAFEFACMFMAILSQHAVGGALCIPSLLGYTGPLVNTLACHGALCEAGWEFQDICDRFYQITLGGEAGKKKNPAAVLVIWGIHHAMGLSMVVPMNISYHDNPYYHEGIFLLQAAAFSALAMQNYGFTLDVRTASGLLQMKILVSLTLAIMLWGRLIRFSFIGYKLLTTFYTDGNQFCLYSGGFSLLCMGMLNCGIVADAFGKFFKFITMRHDDVEVEDTMVENLLGIFLRQCQKHRAKVREAVLMGAFKTKAKKDK